MDQINFIPSDPQRRLETPRDPFQAVPGPWMANPNSSSMSWQSQSPFGSLYLSPPQPFSRMASEANAASLVRLGQQGAMPYPSRPGRDGFAEAFPQFSHPPIYFQAAPFQNMVGNSSSSPANITNADRMPSLQEFGGVGSVPRGVALQQPAAVDWASPGTTSDTHSLSPTHYSFSERIANPLGQQHGSQTVLPAQHPLPPNSTRAMIQGSSAASHRSHRSHGSAGAIVGYRDSSGLLTPVSERRRQAYSRARRTMTSRQTGSDPMGHQSEAMQQPSTPTPSTRAERRVGHSSSQAHIEDAITRHMQTFRGSVSSKMVASKAALRSLQSVKIADLDENEKTCVICYNDFGSESPEGINEAPLRIPHCHHVFGDHCIKKWLEDSDSCPYCRHKLPSEPKHCYGSARSFLNMMRMRGVQLPPGFSEDMLSRMVGGPFSDDEFGGIFVQTTRPAERRSPPDDASDQDHRRTRQRRESSGSGVARRTESVATQTTASSTLPLSSAMNQSPTVPNSVSATQPPFRLLSPQNQPRVSTTAQQQPRVSFSMPFGYVSGQASRHVRHAETSETTARQSNIPHASTSRATAQPEESIILNPLQELAAESREHLSPELLARDLSGTSGGAQSAGDGFPMLRPQRNRPW